MPGLTQHGASAGERIASADLLRGIAAFSVAWFHFTNGGTLLDEGWLKASGSHGWLGVHAFFVISGFVIPLSMHRAGYVLRAHVATFLFKRLVRLEPPYLLAVAACVVLAALAARTPGFAGRPFDVDPRQILLHLGYLNGFFDVPWLNPVFWSLAIEFQFYLCMTALYPLIVNARAAISIATLACVSLLSLASSDPSLVLLYGPLFAFGVIGFWRVVGRISAPVFLLLTALNTALAASALGPAVSGVGAGTALILVLTRLAVPRPLLFLGAVSYSLYLLHVPVGGRIVNLGARMAHDDAAKLLVLVAAAAGSILAAWILFRFIERPAQRWSARIRYA